MVTKDYFSKWIDIKQTKTKGIDEVIGHFRSLFAITGTPEIVMSDNVPFDSKEFKDFANEYVSRVTTSSQSNGMSVVVASS